MRPTDDRTASGEAEDYSRKNSEVSMEDQNSFAPKTRVGGVERGTKTQTSSGLEHPERIQT